jgi:hypothetical protein
MDAAAANAVTTLFSETFYGVGNENGTWFNENAPESGLCGVLDRASAEAASKAPGPGRRSVVSHARHALTHIEHVTKLLRGEASKVDWKMSFEPGAATPGEWDELRRRMRASSRALLETLVGAPDDKPDMLESSIGSIAHAAYHLGAIRQVLADVGAPAATKK